MNVPANTDDAYGAALEILRRQVHADAGLSARLYEARDIHELWLALRPVTAALGVELDEASLNAAWRDGGRAWRERRAP